MPSRTAPSPSTSPPRRWQLTCRWLPRRLPDSPRLLSPRIPQCHRAVEHGRAGPRVGSIGHEVAVALELEALLGLRLLEGGLEVSGENLFRIRIDVVQEVALAGARMRHPEETIVQPHLC